MYRGAEIAEQKETSRTSNGAHREHNYRWIYRATGSAGSLALAYHNAPRAWTGSDRASLTQMWNVTKFRAIGDTPLIVSQSISLLEDRLAPFFADIYTLYLKSTGLDLFREFCCFAQLKNFSFRRPLTTCLFKLFQKSFPLHCIMVKFLLRILFNSSSDSILFGSTNIET